MPSDALIIWQTDRMRRLQDVEADCLHLETLHAADPDRVQQHIRSYAVLLSSEFQGFCRELHSECAQRFVDSVSPPALQALLWLQCVYGRKLDTGNLNPGNLGADFGRYEPDFWSRILALDPTHAARRHRLAMLNNWRNAIAHHDFNPADLGGTTTLAIVQVRNWLADCDVFAKAFDAVMRDRLLIVTGAVPWPP